MSATDDAYPQHDLERYLLQTFELDRDRLQKMALFLLAHIVVDTRLIALVVSDRSHDSGLSLDAIDFGLSADAIQRISDRASKQTFQERLDRARPHLSEDNAAIAKELNRARNALLHWERNRVPVYKGADVTTEDGSRACMDDVLRFIQTVPFPTLLGGGSQT